MKNLYNEADKNEILNRLENLKVDAVRQWGKMNIVQMLAHLNVSLETPLGKNFPKRAFIGRLIGKLVKKSLSTTSLCPKIPLLIRCMSSQTSLWRILRKKSNELKELITLFL